MAATDIRGDLSEYIIGNPTDLKKTLCFVLDVTAEDSGILTQATHKLCNIPTGHAVVGGSVVTITAATSGGAATIQWKFNNGSIGDVLSAAGAIADAYAAGDVFNLVHNDYEDTTGGAGYVAVGGTQGWLEFIVATADLTAGKFFVTLDLIDVGGNL
jgi:hypothetical protein